MRIQYKHKGTGARFLKSALQMTIGASSIFLLRWRQKRETGLDKFYLKI